MEQSTLLFRFSNAPQTEESQADARSTQGFDPEIACCASVVNSFFEHLARPQGLAFNRDGNLFVVAIYQGERGIFRIGANGQAALNVAGENLVGLTFDSGGRMVIASTNAIYRLSGSGIGYET